MNDDCLLRAAEGDCDEGTPCAPGVKGLVFGLKAIEQLQMCPSLQPHGQETMTPVSSWGDG